MSRGPQCRQAPMSPGPSTGQASVPATPTPGGPGTASRSTMASSRSSMLAICPHFVRFTSAHTFPLSRTRGAGSGPQCPYRAPAAGVAAAPGRGGSNRSHGEPPRKTMADQCGEPPLLADAPAATFAVFAVGQLDQQQQPPSPRMPQAFGPTWQWSKRSCRGGLIDSQWVRRCHRTTVYVNDTASLRLRQNGSDHRSVAASRNRVL